MKFCPSCQTRLKKSDSGLKCPRCGHSEGGDGKKAAAEEPAIKELGNPEFNVLDENEGKETLPTIKIECEKCGHGEAVWWMLQTRSADEATTQFYRCIKCNHTWRNYD